MHDVESNQRLRNQRRSSSVLMSNVGSRSRIRRVALVEELLDLVGVDPAAGLDGRRL